MVQDDVPDFEFVDLPEIQTFPEEQFQRTSQLVRAYLEEPDTLVLCVVDATTPALDSSPALMMIGDAGKLHQTILALTKSDLLTSEIGQVENSFDRVLRQSAEVEHLKGLAGCVAVTDRDCTDCISLAQADSVERHVFEALLKDPADAFATTEVQEELQQNMGSRRLLQKLDAMFHNYIVQHWKPAAQQNLEAVALKFKSSISDWGTLVELFKSNSCNGQDSAASRHMLCYCHFCSFGRSLLHGLRQAQGACMQLSSIPACVSIIHVDMNLANACRCIMKTCAKTSAR